MIHRRGTPAAISSFSLRCRMTILGKSLPDYSATVIPIPPANPDRDSLFRLSRVFGATTYVSFAVVPRVVFRSLSEVCPALSFGLAQYLQKCMKRKDSKNESLGEGGRLIEIGEAKD